MTTAGTCITDGPGNYINYENCIFVALRNVVITPTEFATELNYDKVTFGSTTLEGPYPGTGKGGGDDGKGGGSGGGYSVSAGQQIRFTSDNTGIDAGFIICAVLAPGPPVPPYPPVPPLAPNGVALRLPQLDVTFEITPILSQVASTANLQALTAAVGALASCSGASPCTVSDVTAKYAPSPPAAPPSGTVPAVIVFVDRISARISWLSVNRTASCAPPPPKAPGQVDNASNTRDPASCVYFSSMPPESLVAAEAARSLLIASRTSAQTQLAANGMPAAFALASVPEVRLGLAATAITFPPSPPPQPSTPPPPPSPPSPPSPPPGLCSDLCNGGRGNGLCEDGGPGSVALEAGTCQLGSDCSDCGVRIYCVDCPAECQAVNSALSNPLHACFQSNYRDGMCTPACNNLACGYDGGDCSPSQIQAACDLIPVAIDFTTPPTTQTQRMRGLGLPDAPCTLQNASSDGGVSDVGCSNTTNPLVPVAMQMSLENSRLLIHDTFKEMFVLLELEYTLQWQDDRLFRHPCYGALEHMISFGRDVGRSDNARSRKQETIDRFWMKKLQADSLVPGYDVLDEFAKIKIEREREWLNGVGPFRSRPNAPTKCQECVTRTAAVELEVVQTHFDFYFYPFDQQILKLRFQVEGAHLYTCSNATALQDMLPMDQIAIMENKLLPLTREWLLAGSPTSSLKMHHPTVDGEVKYDMCDFELQISRSFLVFFVKSMITTLVVVGGSLITALFMHPDELAGDRCAVLFIAFLILVYNMQVDLGLGALTQLLWLDVFNIIQCCMVLFALAESSLVHILLKTQRDSIAIQIDKVLRITIPWMLYPIVTASTILWGLEQQSLCPDSPLCGLGTGDPRYWARGEIIPVTMSSVAAAFGTVGLLAFIFISFFGIMLRFRHVAREQVFSVIALVELAFSPDEKLKRQGVGGGSDPQKDEPVGGGDRARLQRLRPRRLGLDRPKGAAADRRANVPPRRRSPLGAHADARVRRLRRRARPRLLPGRDGGRDGVLLGAGAKGRHGRAAAAHPARGRLHQEAQLLEGRQPRRLRARAPRSSPARAAAWITC